MRLVDDGLFGSTLKLAKHTTVCMILFNSETTGSFLTPSLSVNDMSDAWYHWLALTVAKVSGIKRPLEPSSFRTQPPEWNHPDFKKVKLVAYSMSQVVFVGISQGKLLLTQCFNLLLVAQSWTCLTWIMIHLMVYHGILLVQPLYLHWFNHGPARGIDPASWSPGHSMPSETGAWATRGSQHQLPRWGASKRFMIEVWRSFLAI